jgi:hypothetical protein
MERSIAARYAAHQPARFVSPSARARERRLGLRSGGSFRAAPTRQTVLRRPGGSVLAHLRGDWRAIRAAQPRRDNDGRPRPSVAMHWTGSALAGSTRRSSAATAPWRA